MTQPHDFRPRPLQKRRLRLVWQQFHRRTERHAAEQRHRQHLALGQNAIEIVHQHRHQFGVGTLLREMIQAALEWLRVGTGETPAFRENDDRTLVAHRFENLRDGIVMRRRFLTLDENRVKNLLRDVQPDFARRPVIPRRHRSRQRAHFRREHRPENQRVEIARVVREINSLPRVRCAASPTAIRTADQSRERRHKIGRHLDSSSFRMRLRRRAMVMRQPMQMSASAG